MYERSPTIFCRRLFLKKVFTERIFCDIIIKKEEIMKYTIKSNKYIAKNLFYILPFAVIPAFFLSVSTDENALRSILSIFFGGEPQRLTFSELFRAISVLNFGSWRSVVFGLLGIILIVICVAMMMAMLEKHFRIGKRSYRGLLSKLNDNLVSTAGFTFLLTVLYEVWALVTTLGTFIFSKILFNTIAYIMSALFLIIMHIALIYAIGFIYLWLPCMQITGFRAMQALYYSQRMVSPVKWGILFGQLAMLLFAETLICLCAIFAPNPIVFTLLTTVLYTWLIMLFCVRMEIVYFEREHLDRADVFQN